MLGGHAGTLVNSGQAGGKVKASGHSGCFVNGGHIGTFVGSGHPGGSVKPLGQSGGSVLGGHIGTFVTSQFGGSVGQFGLYASPLAPSPGPFFFDVAIKMCFKK